jgi:predicted metalloprotease
MKLGDVRQSDNVQDRRGGGGGGAVKASGAVLVIAVLISVATGQDPLALLDALSGDPGAPAAAGPVDANDPGAVFTRKVLATTEDAWTAALPQMGKGYAAPTLVLFRGQVESACGLQEAAVGPFYCPGDRKAYLDLDFLDELQTKLGAQGDFAAAYVIAHEVGHHVQKLLGTSDRVSAEGKDKGPKGNAVRLELQADCYAGVWGAYANKKGLLEVGDVEEALGAASAIGDDTLQRRAKGRVNPESFSHGSSEQRVRWFKRGMENGDPRSCDTFAASAL